MSLWFFVSPGVPMSENTYIPDLLSQMEKINASDLHLKVGSPPIFRVKGTPQRIKADALSPETMDAAIHGILGPREQNMLTAKNSVDFAYSMAGVGRFRVNIFRQRGTYSLVARRVGARPPTFDELMLPPTIAKVAEFVDGLVLVAGVTGSGKSSTLAAIIELINQNERCHILTLEDPIEFLYRDAKSFTNQRELGVDVNDFPSALKDAMREDPDVILVGEMRDTHTVEAALAAAETGHLVFSTLHASNTVQTIVRVLEFFPADRQPSIRALMSYVYRAAIAQRILPSARPERARVPVVEALFVNTVVRKYIADNEDFKISRELRSNVKDGMQDFNMALYRLVKDGWLTEEMALANSNQPEQLSMQLRGMVLNQDATTV